MSRIGKKPIDIPSGVKVSVEGAEVKVEGKSTLAMPLPPHVSVDRLKSRTARSTSSRPPTTVARMRCTD